MAIIRPDVVCRDVSAPRHRSSDLQHHSLRPVINLHAADLQAGQRQDEEAQYQQSHDSRCRCGRGRIDGKEGEQTVLVHGCRFRYGDRAQRLQIEDHAHLLQDRGQEAVHSLPHQHNYGGNEWVPEEQARRKKDAAVSDAGQKRDTEVCREVCESMLVEKVLLEGIRAEVAVHGNKLQQGAGTEDDRRREQAGEEFPNHQDFPPQRRQEIVMQALLQHLPPKKIAEDPHAAEEDGQPQKEELENGSEDMAVLAQVAMPAILQLDEGMGGVEHHGREGQKVNPCSAAGEESLSYLEAEDGQNLRSPERPGQPLEAHLGGSSAPIRYS
ncbi:hypothetical protein SBA2_580017 [Acidobacteriia bacterium SbA2]|nr:hypothetical protein SBA2_580017 [Acidobacteriia bacterium SbA2]